MSANNELRVQKYGKIYRVSNVDLDGSGGYFIDNKEYKTLTAAIRAANKYIDDPNNEVEYGLNIPIVLYHTWREMKEKRNERNRRKIY